MCALFPDVFSGFEWPLFDESFTSLSHYNITDQNCIYKDTPIPHSVELKNSSPDQALQVQDEVQRCCTPSSPSPISPDAVMSSDPSMAKKLHHNASERDRRKKINYLYSSLRSMLPLSHQTKKLSIPATISRVVKYIPELEKEVEGLRKKKEKLLLRISREGGEDGAALSKARKFVHHNSVVSTSSLNDSEAVIQISSYDLHKTPISQILLCLETQGLLLLNASSFHTFEGRVFYNLHFQVENKNGRLESDILSRKLLSILYEKKEGVFNF
ncbi:transcription factor ORG2-like [Senna tora]|uniref:Transcription factor ORG2-like n=1 Tax=Senna tora TaxID=362788 RepID=A0A834SKA5_9FABA|nr:transcription factor ORG2-like [Senna tora]